MKVGDLVRVKEKHWSNRGEVGIIVDELFADSEKNRGRAFKVLFPHGKIRPKLHHQLEVISESR